jgi:hypothetical protein
MNPMEIACLPLAASQVLPQSLAQVLAPPQFEHRMREARYRGEGPIHLVVLSRVTVPAEMHL